MRGVVWVNCLPKGSHTGIGQHCEPNQCAAHTGKRGICFERLCYCSDSIRREGHAASNTKPLFSKTKPVSCWLHTKILENVEKNCHKVETYLVCLCWTPRLLNLDPVPWVRPCRGSPKQQKGKFLVSCKLAPSPPTWNAEELEFWKLGWYGSWGLLSH